MEAVDMAPVIRAFPGFFVALSKDRRMVMGKGHTPEDALKEARKNGIENPVLTKIPEDNRSYLL